MTIEIIVFIAAILFGIVWYVRESKNNKLVPVFQQTDACQRPSDEGRQQKRVCA